jgi:hypothetical protein
LTEDVKSGRWNYQGLQARPGPKATAGVVRALPEIVLRNAQVDYLEVKDGKETEVGWIALDGRFGPGGNPLLNEFSFQSRGRQAMGPTVEGTVNLHSSRIEAKMRNFVFGPDIQAMLPSQVRQWCRDHAVAGRMDVTVDTTLNTEEAAAPDYHVEADLEGVEFSMIAPAGVPPLALHKASGTLVFSNSGIGVKDVTAWVEQNGLTINGSVGGYSTDAPFDLTLKSLGVLDFPEHWPALAALPADFKGVYKRFLPRGKSTVMLRAYRTAAGEAARCEADVNILDGGFTFGDIPYPISHAAGRIVYGPDKELGIDAVRLMDVHGHGIIGGPNEKADISVAGWVGSFGPGGGGYIEVKGRNWHTEAAVLAALPPPARLALAQLDGKELGARLGFNADFDCVAQHAQTPPGVNTPWPCATDITVSDSDVTYAQFAYPLHKIAGRVEVREGYVNIVGLTAHHGAAAIAVDGRVNFGGNDGSFSPDLTVSAKDVAINEGLLKALGDEPREFLKKVGATGRLDAAGRVTGADMKYDLNLTLKDGAVAAGGKVQASDLAGHVHITSNAIEIADLTGRRREATLAAHGVLDMTTMPRGVRMTADATNLALDQSLHDLLPAEASVPWDYLHPTGTIDASLIYDNRAETPVQLMIRPRDLAVAPKLSVDGPALPLSHVTGSVSWLPDREAKWEVSAQRGAAVFNLGGSWTPGKASDVWEMRLSGRNVAVDNELTSALPEGIADCVRALKVGGAVNFDCTNLTYRPGPLEKLGPPDVDFTVKVDCKDAAMDVGVPVTELEGSAYLVGTVRAGRLNALNGDLSAASLRLAGREAHDFSAVLAMPDGTGTIRITGLKGEVAGGTVAGDLSVGLPDSGTGAGKYAVNLILNGGDVRELSGSTDDKLHGKLAASLQMTGSINDPSVCQGTGDVAVAGEQMYQIPLLLGLFQVTNLTLPISAPFDRATARYSLQGQRVSLEKIIISSKQTAMKGAGHIDFGSKEVELTFETDNPGWINVPIVGPMWSKAQNELLRVHVKGTIQHPKVSASSMDTITTTVDQVLRGEPGK